MKKNGAILWILGIFIFSCKHVYTDPTVTITEVVNGGTYHNNDTVHMNITMSDLDKLHEGYLYLKSDTDTFFAYQPYVHGLSSYTLDTFWVVNGIVKLTGVDAFVTGVAHNHQEGITTIDIPIKLFP